MFAFVKSILGVVASESIEEQAITSPVHTEDIVDVDTTSSQESEQADASVISNTEQGDDAVSEGTEVIVDEQLEDVTNHEAGEKINGDKNVVTQSYPRCSMVEDNQKTSLDLEECITEPESLEKACPSVTKLSEDMSSFEGALYSVQGLSFSCLLPHCEATVTCTELIFSPKGASLAAARRFSLQKVSGPKQHMADAFQFTIKNSKEGGEEYGFQLRSKDHALPFRAKFFKAILRIGVPIIHVECAIAEYDTKNREFVILSKSGTVAVIQNPFTFDHCLALSPTEAPAEPCSSEDFLVYLDDSLVVVDNLSRELQIWPSPSTNQITFWGFDQRKTDCSVKTMFMLEMNPESVGAASINLFFGKLALILQDRSFLRCIPDTKSNPDGCSSPRQADVSQLLREEDGFDTGPKGAPGLQPLCLNAIEATTLNLHVTDTSMQLAWKKGRCEVKRTSHAAEDNDASEVGDYDDSNSQSDSDTDTEMALYDPGTSQGPMYARANATDALIHRFMEVVKICTRKRFPRISAPQGSDRTFVCRGDVGASNNLAPYANTREPSRLQLKVYKKEEGYGEDVLESVGVIDGDKFRYKGQTFVPSKGLLHQEERNLLVVSENDMSGNVYMMDLETEKVVQKCAANTMVETMFPTFKTASASVDPTFLCTNNHSVFLMDTRISGASAKTTGYSYATNPQLSVGATDINGHIVLGSRLGDLRLYDGQANASGNFKRAKTLLQTIKEPITAVDVTHDGSWILATTKTYLVVFPTKLCGTNRTGFETALGQHKPAPRYLMLSADDMIKYQITDITFAPAKFDAEEDSIVTSTGNMAVVWDFGTVKRGKPFYSVRFADDTIKDVQISTDSPDVVVAYPTAVGLFGTEKRKI